jgi:hypothetical protein
MEVFPYILDVVMFVFACYWSAANAARDPGTPTFGLFRYREKPKAADSSKPGVAQGFARRR